MVQALDMTPFRYIPESDRESKEDRQTVFWVISRTVRQVNADTAAQLRKIMNRGQQGKESTFQIAKELTERQSLSFAECVVKIENLIVPENAPYDFFNKRKSLLKQKGVEWCLESTEDRDLIQDIFFILHSNLTAEVVNAADKESRVSEEEKN